MRRCVTGITEETLRRTFDGGVDTKYLKQLSVYAVDSAGICRGQLTIEIDWERYEVHVREGRDSILATGWTADGASIDVDELTVMFCDFARAHGFRVDWVVFVRDNIDKDVAFETLGLVSTSAPKFRDGKVPRGMKSRIMEMDEMSVGLNLDLD
jgi:hypothetical protein